jgi:hypothetical protein
MTWQVAQLSVPPQSAAMASTPAVAARIRLLAGAAADVECSAVASHEVKN